jgi:DNA-directed RNA polymerase specialized sigma24 family protein
METLFACLPERQRSVLWLAAVEGYSVEEIAEILETSIRSVKSLVHRARAGLPESLLAKPQESNGISTAGERCPNPSAKALASR